MDQPGTPTRPDPPSTGDRSVDEALSTFARSLDGPPGEQVEAAVEAHRALQARLTTPVPTSASPADARPGPSRR